MNPVLSYFIIYGSFLGAFTGICSLASIAVSLKDIADILKRAHK